MAGEPVVLALPSEHGATNVITEMWLIEPATVPRHEIAEQPAAVERRCPKKIQQSGGRRVPVAVSGRGRACGCDRQHAAGIIDAINRLRGEPR